MSFSDRKKNRCFFSEQGQKGNEEVTWRVVITVVIYDPSISFVVGRIEPAIPQWCFSLFLDSSDYCHLCSEIFDLGTLKYSWLDPLFYYLRTTNVQLIFRILTSLVCTKITNFIVAKWSVDCMLHREVEVQIPICAALRRGERTSASKKGASLFHYMKGHCAGVYVRLLLFAEHR